MGLDKYEKTLKRLFAKFDTDEEWGYGEEGFLKRNHPSIIGFNNWVYQTIDWITDITEALTDEKKFMEHIEFPAQKGYEYLSTFEDGENMLDSYIAGDVYGIKLDDDCNVVECVKMDEVKERVEKYREENFEFWVGNDYEYWNIGVEK